MAEAAEVERATANANVEEATAKEETPLRRRARRGFSLRFWRRRGRGDGEGEGERRKPDDAAKVGCGAFLRRRRRSGRGQSPVTKPQAAEKQSQAPPSPNGQLAAAVAELPFDDVELPKETADGGEDDESEHSVADEVVAVKVVESQAGWARPPSAKEAKKAETKKPKTLLARLAGGKAKEEENEAKNSSQSDEGKETEAKNSSQSDDGKGKEAKNSSQLEDDKEKEAKNSSQSEAGESESERTRREEAERRFNDEAVDMSEVRAREGVKIEMGPQTSMWSSVVNKSLVGTGLVARAAVCNSASGAVLACRPAEFTPTMAQVRTLVAGFETPSTLKAGFGLADTVFHPVKMADSDESARHVVRGVDDDETQGALVARCNTVLLIVTFTSGGSRAIEMVNQLREAFTQQGL